MKIIERDILNFQESIFFSPVRNKIEYVRVLVHAARQLLLNSNADGSPISSIMKLKVDKMSRLFFYKEHKYFSISFPFLLTMDGVNVTELRSYSGKNLDFKSISAIISVIDSEEFKLNPSLIDVYIEPHSIDSSDLSLLEEILQFEPSYIRFDSDAANENGKLHPLNHLDINYSQYGVYKLGLNKQISKDYFENLQNITTDCLFVVD